MERFVADAVPAGRFLQAFQRGANMAWQKPDDALVSRFAAILPSDSRVERRKMFGCPCAFTGGNMFAGLHEQNLIIRLPSERREALIAAGSARPFVVMGRAMREYVAVQGPMDRSEALLNQLVAEAFGFASALPVKEKKARTPRT